MRIVIDLDGTICPIKQAGHSYEDLIPNVGAREKIHTLRSAGHYIIIQTARNMATCEGNVGKVIKNVGKITLDWLQQYNIEYDEIFFGKPNGHIYLDDRACRFTSWDVITETSLAELAKEK